MPEELEPDTAPKSSIPPPLAESDDLDDLLNPDGTIKDSPARPEVDE